MLVGYRVLFVEGDDYSSATLIDIRQLAQCIGFSCLCMFVSNRIGYLDGKFVIRDIEIHFDIGVVEIYTLIVRVVPVFAE